MRSKKLLSIALPLLFLATVASATEMQIDFAVHFNQRFDFATSQMTTVNESTTATVTLELKAPPSSQTQYWGSQVQGITTYFGPPLVSSPIFRTLPRRPDNLVWQETTHSSASISNIDYSISWPENFFGIGPKVTYQFHGNHSFQNKSLVWQGTGGLSLYPPVPADEIAARTANDFINYVHAAYINQNFFSTGFNAFLTDIATSKNLYGLSYQGTATISDVRVTSSVPEPQTLLLTLLGLIGIGAVGGRPIGRPHSARSPSRGSSAIE